MDPTTIYTYTIYTYTYLYLEFQWIEPPLEVFYQDSGPCAFVSGLSLTQFGTENDIDSVR